MKNKKFYSIFIGFVMVLVLFNVFNTMTRKPAQVPDPEVKEGTNDIYGLPVNDTAYAWLDEITAKAEPQKTSTFEREGEDGKKEEVPYVEYDPKLLESAGIQNVKEYGDLTAIGEDAEAYAITYKTDKGEFVACQYLKNGGITKAVNPDVKKSEVIYTYEYNMPEE